MQFASDNTGPAAPQVMDALMRANEGYAPSYGTDPIMERVRDRVREVFEAPDAAVYLVPTGTSANALSLAVLAKPWDGIFVHRTAHVEEDEAGAPEFYTGGAKLIVVDGANGKMTPDGLKAAVGVAGMRGVHSVQRGPVSITQVTELGTVWGQAELRAVTSVAKGAGIGVHMDGARFANAVAAGNTSPAEMTWKSGVDVLSFGGTKNGCLGVEAVVLFNPDLAWEFELRRKRAGHLFSKHRYLSAQMDAYLDGGLWLDLAAKANAAGKALSDGIATAGGRILFPTDANMVFAAWPRSGHARLQEAGARYYTWPGDVAPDGDPDEEIAARLVCNWATGADDIARFLDILRG